jgi:hypothetical protein
MKNLNTLLITFTLLVTQTIFIQNTASAYALAELHKPHYKITFTLPDEKHWRMDDQAKNPGEYHEVYFPRKPDKKNDQQVVIEFHPTVTALRTSRQEVIDAPIPCQRKNSQILGESKDSIIFNLEIEQCPKKSFKQVYKIFNKPDGQYIIFHIADNKVPEKKVEAMQSAVKDAQIVPYP